jgi:hypothetical protein
MRVRQGCAVPGTGVWGDWSAPRHAISVPRLNRPARVRSDTGRNESALHQRIALRPASQGHHRIEAAPNIQSDDPGFEPQRVHYVP